LILSLPSPNIVVKTQHFWSDACVRHRRRDFFGDRAKAYSEKTAEMIDAEIEALTREATTRAEAVLRANKKHLAALAAALLEKETLEEKSVQSILKDTTLPVAAKLH